MTDLEQAEREIAAENGLEIRKGAKASSFAGEKMRVASAAHEDSLWIYDGIGKAVWEGWVRDRCSLLKLTEALKMVRGFKRALDNDGCQISSDTRHVRCLRQFAVDVDKLAESALSALEGK